jgi:hypothetical protein
MKSVLGTLIDTRLELLAGLSIVSDGHGCYSSSDAPSLNAVGASARLRRAPGYTAPKPCGFVNDLGKLYGA